MKDTKSLSDVDAFYLEMQDVTPLESNNTAALSKPEKRLSQALKRAALEQTEHVDTIPFSTIILHRLKPYDEVSYKKDGVQGKVFKNLRLGKYKVDSAHNLVSLDLDSLRVTVFDTVNECFNSGVRMLLLRHGLGLNNKPYPGLIKSAINQWLPQLEQVIACHSALRSHGGLGSTYVLLKKNEQLKTANRERHRKK